MLFHGPVSGGDESPSRAQSTLDATRYDAESTPRSLCLGPGLEHLAALVHAGLEVDVVRAAQFAGILVLDIGRRA